MKNSENLRDSYKGPTYDMIDNITSSYQTFRNEPVELITIIRKTPNVYQDRFIRSLNNSSNIEDHHKANFIHAVCTLNLFRHKYISECYEADITRLSIIIPRYEKDLYAYLTLKPNSFRLIATQQIIKLALFLESLRLQDYDIKLGDLRFEKFEKSFTIKCFNFYDTFFQDTDGKLSKKSADSLSKVIGLVFGLKEATVINEIKELELVMICDSVSMNTVDNYLRDANFDCLELIFQVCKILDNYSKDTLRVESLYLLRKVARLFLSKNFKNYFRN